MQSQTCLPSYQNRGNALRLLFVFKCHQTPIKTNRLLELIPYQVSCLVVAQANEIRIQKQSDNQAKPKQAA